MTKAALQKAIRDAVRTFWSTRSGQEEAQGRLSGKRDHGGRSAVTGGKQLDGFVDLVRKLLVSAGLTEADIHSRQARLPGYFRPTKDWDLLVVSGAHLVATIEFKSQVGPSFGNNFNNRTEEALGSATDLWTAFREGAFEGSVRPWLGYFMLLEETTRSIEPARLKSPHFPAFTEFQGASYQRRYELFCLRLVRERLYDHACFMTSSREHAKKGEFREPLVELSFQRFAASLSAHVAAFKKLQD